MSAPTQSFGLSPQQAFILRTGPGAVSQCLVALAADTSADRVHERLRELVVRHESLRTTFPLPSGASVPVAQAIHEAGAPGFEVLADDGSLAELRAREADRVDAEQGPSLRGLVIEREGERLLLLTAPAACADPHSLALLAAQLSGADEPESEPIQHADYAAWRQELRQGDDPEAVQGRKFWEAVAEGLDPLPAPLTAAAEEPLSPSAGTAAIALDPATLAALPRQAQELRVAPALILEAAWLALLARWTGAAELLTVHVGGGRSLEDLADAVGPYAQPLAVRVAAGPETRFRELVDRLSRAVAQGERWADYASERDLEQLADRAVAGFSAPASEAVEGIHLLSAPPTGCPLELDWLVEAHLTLRFDETRDARSGQDLLGGLRELLESVLEDPSRALGELPMLTRALTEELLELADGGPALAATPVHVAFAQHAAAAPDRPAVTAAGRTLSYGELAAQAARIAERLRALGVTAEQPVGLCLRRSPELLSGLLGTLMSGGAYLPLNPGHPIGRLAHQLSEAGARVVLTERQLGDRFAGLDGVTTLHLDTEDFAPAAVGEASEPTPGELAYVMYTSGSTGTPKGVAVTHANLAAYTAAILDRLELPGELHFASVSDISTDLGNTAIFPALASGGCIHLIDPDTAMDGEALAGYVAAHPIDVMKVTPTHLRALLGASDAFLPRRWLIVGGEALSWELARRLREVAPGCRLLNHYGPTETTVGCCTFEVRDDERLATATVPIGRPLRGARAYVLDGHQRPVPYGVVGELCVGGAGVARGYLGLPAQTAERFLTDPRGGRMYRTGDRVRMDRAGRIEFIGRNDEQLKIRGFRVEPGEVEAALLRHPAVTGAAVVPHGEAADVRLVGYFAATGEPGPAELQAFLEQSLPDYMVPSRWVRVPALPLTASGKVDRQALPAPDAAAPERAQSFVAPRDELERAIAAIWSELLGIDEVGVTDDFFALGGHSLMATQAVMRIRRQYGNVPLGAMFSAPTVAALADIIRARAA